jgi:hypothetical protein
MNSLPRFYRWVNSSHTAAKYETFMVVSIQGLGRLDHDLYEQDKLISKNPEALSLGGDPGALSHHITLSYLWVLGAYEVIRSIRQRIRQLGVQDEALTTLLRKFERLRMPLAKFETSDRHKKTDSRIAYPALNSQYGIAWQVSENTFFQEGSLPMSYLLFWRAGVQSPRPNNSVERDPHKLRLWAPFAAPHVKR